MLYCDNKPAVEVADNLLQHERTQHLEINQHFIREKIVG